MSVSSIPRPNILQRILLLLEKSDSKPTGGEELLKGFEDNIKAGNHIAPADINQAVELLGARKFVDFRNQDLPSSFRFTAARITDAGRIALQAFELAGTADSSAQVQPSATYRLWVASGVTAGALILLAVKLWAQSLNQSLKLDDSVSIGLLIVAVLPWVSQLLSSVKLPGGWEFVFREIKEKQEKQGTMLLNQQEQIQALRTAVRGIVTKHEFNKLVGLSKDEPFMVTYCDDMFNELKRLRALNLLRHHEGTGLAQMARDHKENKEQFDLKRYFFIMEEGRKYLKIRSDADKEDSQQNEANGQK